MSLLSTTLRRSSLAGLARGCASSRPPRTTAAAATKDHRAMSSSSSSSSSSPSSPSSSCPAGTVLTGLNYLKDEPPVLAKPDEDYPAWLWELTTTSTSTSTSTSNSRKSKPNDHGDPSGGKAEKRRLRAMHRQTLKDNNMFKAK